MSARPTVLAGICSAFLLALPVVAGAADDTAKSKVKITEGGPELFEGKVTSKESKCEKGRKVRLHYTDAGPYKGGDTVIGSTKTDADGHWSLDGSFTAGLYYAEVQEKEKGDLTCLAARGIQAQF